MANNALTNDRSKFIQRVIYCPLILLMDVQIHLTKNYACDKLCNITLYYKKKNEHHKNILPSFEVIKFLYAIHNIGQYIKDKVEHFLYFFLKKYMCIYIFSQILHAHLMFDLIQLMNKACNLS